MILSGHDPITPDVKDLIAINWTCSAISNPISSFVVHKSHKSAKNHQTA